MSAPDVVRRLSDELAQDPGSLAFLELGELLRQQGERDLAFRIALRGLERHPHHADAHDLLARLYVDAGELDKAYDEWDMVVRLSPEHAGAQKGMGYIRFQQGRLEDAERHLDHAAILDPGDESNTSALAYVRTARSNNGATASAERAAPTGEVVRTTPPEPLPATHRTAFSVQQSSSIHPSDIFQDLLAGGDQAAMLLDEEGLVLAGTYPGPDGQDIAQEVGAGLSGVSEEAERAMRHLGMGTWTSLVFETDGATLAMGPGPDGGLVLVAASRATPLGFVRRLLERVGERAKAWLGAEARP